MKNKLNCILTIGFIFLLFCNSFGKSIKPVRINADSLNKTTFTLSLPWKYHSGDNMEWSKQNFNDENWDTIRTIIPTAEPVFDSFTGIGWFRRTIIIDSSLMNKPAALFMKHYGASEIYLNGKLVHKFGMVARSAANEKIYQPRNIPIILQFGDDSLNVIAVRYSNFHSVNDKDWYKKWFNYAGFQISLSEINGSILHSVHNEGISLSLNFGISTIFLSLSILYLILFFFYSMKKENLYYSLFTFFIFLTFLVGVISKFEHSNLNMFVIQKLLRDQAFVWIFPSYLAFLYSIFYKKFPKQFWGFLFIAIGIALSFAFITGYKNVIDYFFFGFIFIATVEGLRIIIVAIKAGKKNAGVIGIGVAIFVLFVMTMFTLGFLGKGNINSLWGIIFFILGLLSLPFSMSVYLARDVAFTNKKLEKQIITVKELSEKQIRQERKNAELKLQAELAEAENERKSKELEEARRLQLSMLPSELPNLPNLDIAVYMQTATEVGGDYYDFRVEPDGTLTAIIGDATGHGLNAGTVVTAAKSLLNSLAGNPDIVNTFTEVSNSLRNMNFKFLSMCLAILKIKNNKISISSAGMPPAIIYRKNKRAIEEIVLKGMPLGTAINFPYQTFETQLYAGDAILLMSDGYPELFNDKKEMFGYKRAAAEFLAAAEGQPEEIISHLKKSASDWVNGNPPQDDVTFIVLKITE